MESGVQTTENAPVPPRGAAHVRFNCVYLRRRGTTAADATPPRRSRLGLAGL